MHLNMEPSVDPSKVELVEQPVDEVFGEQQDDMQQLVEHFEDPLLTEIKQEPNKNTLLRVPSFIPQHTLRQETDRCDRYARSTLLLPVLCCINIFFIVPPIHLILCLHF